MNVISSKSRFIIMVLLILLVLIMTGCSNNELQNPVLDLEINEYVDNQLQDIMQYSDYQNASIEERKQIINQSLSQLKKEKAIRHFSYNKDNYLFSFEYNDGVLGGVSLKDFNSILN